MVRLWKISDEINSRMHKRVHCTMNLFFVPKNCVSFHALLVFILFVWRCEALRNYLLENTILIELIELNTKHIVMV